MPITRDPRTLRGGEVDGDGYQRVSSKTSPYPHWYSEHKGDLYIANFANVSFDTANPNEIVAFIKNTSESNYLTIDEIRCQVVDPGATLPIYTTYLDLVRGLTFSAIGDGSVVTPRNMNFTAKDNASADCYQDNITVTGTAVQLDKRIPLADEGAFLLGQSLSEGGFVLGQNDTIAVRYESATSAGYIYCTIIFHFED